MENYPSNSFRNREQRPPERKKKEVKQVTVNAATPRKKSLTKRTKEVFISDDAGTVWEYILFDVALPAFKSMLSDMVSQGTDRMLYGEGQGYRRSRPTRGITNYSRPSTSTPPWREESRDRRPTRVPSRSSYEFDDLIFPTRGDATIALDALTDLVDNYQMATVADLYSLAGGTADFTWEKWGWTDLRGSRIEQVRDGYLINLPKPQPLD